MVVGARLCDFGATSKHAREGLDSVAGRGVARKRSIVTGGAAVFYWHGRGLGVVSPPVAISPVAIVTWTVAIIRVITSGIVRALVLVGAVVARMICITKLLVGGETAAADVAGLKAVALSAERQSGRKAFLGSCWKAAKSA